ncbi:MAG: hypothetical protein ACHP7H_01485 [Hyphomicrobiales bacterium]
MSDTIAVYDSVKSIRVVRGKHKAHQNAAISAVRVYPDTRLAFAAETDPTIRRAILRIDPTADCGQVLAPLQRVPLAQFFAERGTSASEIAQHDKRARVSAFPETTEQRLANAGVDFFEHDR